MKRGMRMISKEEFSVFSSQIERKGRERNGTEQQRDH